MAKYFNLLFYICMWQVKQALPAFESEIGVDYTSGEASKILGISTEYLSWARSKGGVWFRDWTLAKFGQNWDFKKEEVGWGRGFQYLHFRFD